MWSVYFTAPADRDTRTIVGGNLTPLQRCSHCILQPTPADTATRTLVGRVLPIWPRYSRCILQPQPTWPPETRWGSLIPRQRSSRCILQPSLTDWATRTLQRCSQCNLQLRPTGLPGNLLGKSYSSAEMQSVYYTAPNWFGHMSQLGINE